MSSYAEDKLPSSPRIVVSSFLCRISTSIVVVEEAEEEDEEEEEGEEEEEDDEEEQGEEEEERESGEGSGVTISTCCFTPGSASVGVREK